MTPRAICLLLTLLILSAPAAQSQKRGLPIELEPFSHEQIEKSSVWVFDRQNTLDEHGRCYARLSGGVIYENAGGMCMAYLLRGDTIAYRGYNAGRKEHMLTDSPADAYCLPQGFSSAYASRGLLNTDCKLSAEGVLECKVHGPGRMVVGGDTLHRVYVVEEMHLEIHPHADTLCLWRESLLVYRWLCEDSPLPLAIQREGRGGAALCLADALTLADMGGDEGPGSVEAAADALEAASVRVSGSSLAIDFGGHAADAIIEACLVDINGFAYMRECLAPAEGESVFTFTIPARLSGRHIVSLCLLDNPRLSRKIFVDL